MVAALVVSAVIAAAFPWGLLRGPLERTLSTRLGRPVTIVRLDRLDHFSFSPLVRLSGLRIAQPDWIGRGDMVRIDEAIVRFPVLPLFHGRLSPIEITITGLQLDLVRQASGRANWEAEKPQTRSSGGGSPPRLDRLRIANSTLRLTDDKRHATLTAQLAADAGHGVTIVGDGRLHGRPLHLDVAGGKLDGIDPAAAYPFRVALVSDLVRLTGGGTMDHVLDFAHFTAAIVSSGKDLDYLDDIIEAGVPATQDFRLAATVRHDGRDWKITRLAGTIGRSDLAGSIDVTKREGRTILAGRVAARRFDFGDLSSDAAKARAAAQEKLIGKRILPDTPIHFETLGQTDGTIRLDIAKLLMTGKSPFVGLHATLTMDHRRLTVKPIVATLVDGTLAGEIVVDHRRGEPKLDLRLDLRGGRVEDSFTKATDATAPLDGRIRLHGTGRSIRAALGRSEGTVDLIARGGAMKTSVATLAAGDVIRGAKIVLGLKHEAMTPIRCIVGKFVARDGRLSASDLILDTTIMRAGGSGKVDLGDETIALTLTGRSKNPAPIQTSVPIHVAGTLSAPTFDVVPHDHSLPRKGLFDRIGAIIRSVRTRSDAGRAEIAPDAPCAALAADILGTSLPGAAPR